MADIGWITAFHIVYGPLSLAATSVLYEGVPQSPDAGRPWRIAERLDVNIFHTSPHRHPHVAQGGRRRAQKSMPIASHDHGRRTDRAGSLALVSRNGWGKGEAVIVDLVANRNGGVRTTKPARSHETGSAGPACLGIYPAIWDEEGKGSFFSRRREYTCIRNSQPQDYKRMIWGDPQRFVSNYYKKYNANPHSKDWRDWPYYAADGAVLATRRLLPYPRARR